MFQGMPAQGPFKGLSSIDDIRGNRRWVLGVFNGNPLAPTQLDFDSAQYFQCDGERRVIVTGELEAWQRVGTTTLDNEGIRRVGSYLHMPMLAIKSLTHFLEQSPSYGITGFRRTMTLGSGTAKTSSFISPFSLLRSALGRPTFLHFGHYM